ncbi:MAG TPA: CHAP domain-containing protein [Rhizomicrobium sp.]|nr:CHAP domain-containing protein [Rhizomicrobium sp.]
MGIITKLAAVALLALSLEGCGSTVMNYDQNPMPHEYGRTVTKDTNNKPLQCVPYARAHSDVKLYGDAYTWWDKAEGKYPREAAPELGAVMVLNNYAGPDRAHVAVVSKLVSAREIRVDHANWLDDGSIYVNDPVEDVSQANDWSLVRVFNLKTDAWGGKVYPVQGFIGGKADGRPDLVAGGASPGATALVGEIN